MWECSFGLCEMQDYITKMRGGSVTSSKSQGSQEDGELVDTRDGGRVMMEEELQESSDEGAGVKLLILLGVLIIILCSG